VWREPSTGLRGRRFWPARDVRRAARTGLPRDTARQLDQQLRLGPHPAAGIAAVCFGVGRENGGGCGHLAAGQNGSWPASLLARETSSCRWWRSWSSGNCGSYGSSPGRALCGVWRSNEIVSAARPRWRSACSWGICRPWACWLPPVARSLGAARPSGEGDEAATILALVRSLAAVAKPSGVEGEPTAVTAHGCKDLERLVDADWIRQQLAVDFRWFDGPRLSGDQIARGLAEGSLDETEFGFDLAREFQRPPRSAKRSPGANWCCTQPCCWSWRVSFGFAKDSGKRPASPRRPQLARAWPKPVRRPI